MGPRLALISRIRSISLRLAGALLIAAASLVTGASLKITEQTIRQVSDLYGTRAAERMREWRDLITAGARTEEREKLRLVNDFFNRLRPRADQEVWHKKDYWATPIEAIGRDAADCEDYSLAKYFTLRSMGVAEEKLHITYVKALKYNQAHVVLAYYPTQDAEPLILDNLTRMIRTASQRQDLKPVYSFNGQGLWTSVNRARGKRVGPAEQISLWKDFVERLEQQLGTL